MFQSAYPLHDMGPHGAEIGWPSKPQDKKSRTHNHHISLRERIKEYQNRTQGKHPKSEVDNQETTKAAAWAVFQHHGGGGVGLSQTHGSAFRRPTRFKIEAQMKHEIARPFASESVAASWDAGSTLFDSFELDSLLKTLDQAANKGVSQQKQADEAGPGAMVVYSQKHWVARPNPIPPFQRYNNKLQGQRSFPSRGAVDDGRLDTVDEMSPLKTADQSEQRPISYKLAGNIKLDDLYKQGQDDAESDPFANFGHTPSPFNVRRNARRSFDSSIQEKSGKGGPRDPHHRSKWKSLLHTLHLDSASGLFNRFQGFHAQVAPHDSHKKLENKGSRSRSKAEAKSDQTDGSDGQKHIDSAQTDVRYDPRFDPKNLHISKDVHPPAVKDDHQRNPPQSWKLGLKAVLSRPFSRQGSSLSEKEESASEALRKSDTQRGQKKADLQSAWSSFTSKLHHQQDEHEHGRGQRHGTLNHHSGEQSAIEPVSHHEHHHHYHHHHHHVQPEAEDYELTVQAISRRVSRPSFEEKARKFSIEEGGMKAPRNSLTTPRNSLTTPRNSLTTPRNSLDPSAYEERIRARLTPWEAESGLAKGAYVH